MYQVSKTDRGYTFRTARKVQYELYFNDLHDTFKEFAHPDLLTKQLYYFGLDRISKKTGGRDPFIKETVAWTVFKFLKQNEDAVLIFNYSLADQCFKARRKYFAGWYKEYSQHTLIQMYQHDFSDNATVCAIYSRHGADFDKIRNAIKSTVSDMSTNFNIK